MKQRETVRGTIVAAKRRNNSVNGNPRFDVTVKIDGLALDDHVVLTTSSDSACAYDVENLVRSRELVDIGLTPAGYARTMVRVPAERPAVVDYEVLLDDSAIVVEYSDGTRGDVAPETILRWLIAGEAASR
jgi:hypothetical protein